MTQATIMTKRPHKGELRARIYPIYREYVFEILRRFENLPSSIMIPEIDYIALPDGAECSGAFWDDNVRAICVYVEHESFDVVPDGSMIPRMDSPLDVNWRAVHIAKKAAYCLDGMDIEECRKLRKAVDERIYDLEHGK